LFDAGATWAADPREVASATDTVITMLPDSPDVEAVVEDERGLLAGGHPGLLWIDMSTIAPTTTRRLAAAAAERGIAALDAPVSGGETGARQATLSIMVGGDEAVFERAKPVLDVLGSRVVLCGDTGAGQVVKAANQLVVGGTIALVAEALMLASRAGVDPTRVREALLGGFAQSRILDVHGQRMLDRAFTPGFRLALHRKDMRIVSATAADSGAPIPVGAVVEQLMVDAVEQGAGGDDHAGLLQVYERRAGHDL
jgi:2-hydroxy-3-oxopropionate reductase